VIGDTSVVVPDWVANAIAQAAAAYYLAAWKTDAWLYQNIPSAFGISIPAITGSGYITTGEVKRTYIFNWRSFELDSYNTGELGGTVSLPFGWSASGNLTAFYVMGSSSNATWEGNYASASISAYGVGGIGGAMGGTSYSLGDPADIVTAIATRNPNAALLTDPVSGMNVMTRFVGLGVGSPGVSLSGTIGTTFGGKSIFDLNLPFSIIPRCPGPYRR